MHQSEQLQTTQKAPIVINNVCVAGLQIPLSVNIRFQPPGGRPGAAGGRRGPPGGRPGAAGGAPGAARKPDVDKNG